MPAPRNLGRLTSAESYAAKRMIAKHGAKEAARALGVCDERTLCKAIAGVPVHPLTAAVIRQRLTEKI